MIRFILPIVQVSQADYDAGFRIGRLVGGAIPAAVCLGAVLWCGVILSRPNVNRKGVLALGALFGSWTIALILSFVQLALSVTSPLMKFAIGAPVLLGVLVSIAFAIAALVDGREYAQGRGQAIASLVLSGIIGLVLLGAMALGVAQGVAQARHTATLKAAPAAEGIELPDLRFKLRTLPAPWVQTDAKKMNPLASIGLLRTRPDMGFMLIGEKLEAKKVMSLDAYVAAVKSNLLNADPAAKVLSEGPEAVNGKEGHRMICAARVGNLDLLYRYWIHGSPGMMYQVVAWTTAKDPATVTSGSESLFSNIEILPPQD